MEYTTRLQDLNAQELFEENNQVDKISEEYKTYEDKFKELNTILKQLTVQYNDSIKEANQNDQANDDKEEDGKEDKNLH